MRVDALQKYRNQLLSDFNVESMQVLKRSNWSGMLEDTDRLYATMYHDWDVLQKDSNDLAEAVQTLDWTVAPYVGDGEEATPEAQGVAKVVTDALWKRVPQSPGTFGHSFTQLLGALVHGKFRGFNVHEVEWKFDGDMWFPAMFHQLPSQFMRWEYEAGKPDRLLFVPDGETEEPRPFPDNKFIVALNTTGPDHPLYNATYYPLIAWFGAFKFGLGWFMEYCQKYGLPKLVFHYESESDRRQLEHDLSEEKVLNNILLKGDRAVDIANAPASGASLPQRELLNLAESACHKLILGQTLTSDTSEHGGSLAQAKVHAGVQADVVRKTADYVADILNTQLIPTIVLLNYGTTEVPMPELRAKIPQEGVTQERVQVVKTALEIKGMRLKKSEVYEFTGFSQPADDDEVFEAAAEQPQQGGFGAPFGQEPPPGGEGPQKGQQEPEEGNDEKAKDEEPVSAAKADVPPDPAQSWLAPLKKELLEAHRSGASLAELRKRLVSMRPDTKALARAFANNILAGLSDEGEAVEAANPYGCNQYGEGWASEHNGKRSEPGKPMKKGDPTPATYKAQEDAVKKAEAEAARKEAIAKQKAEDAAKKAAEEEAARKAEEEAKKAEEAKRAEEEAKKAAEEAKKAAEEEKKIIFAAIDEKDKKWGELADSWKHKLEELKGLEGTKEYKKAEHAVELIEWYKGTFDFWKTKAEQGDEVEREKAWNILKEKVEKNNDVQWFDAYDKKAKTAFKALEKAAKAKTESKQVLKKPAASQLSSMALPKSLESTHISLKTDDAAIKEKYSSRTESESLALCKKAAKGVGAMQTLKASTLTRSELDTVVDYLSDAYDVYNIPLRKGESTAGTRLLESAFAKAKLPISLSVMRGEGIAGLREYGSEVQKIVDKYSKEVLTNIKARELYNELKSAFSGKTNVIRESHGLTSTSTSHHAPDEYFDGRIKRVIHVPKGAQAMSVREIASYKNENEILIGPHSLFVTKGVSFDGKYIYIEEELIVE